MKNQNKTMEKIWLNPNCLKSLIQEVREAKRMLAPRLSLETSAGFEKFHRILKEKVPDLYLEINAIRDEQFCVLLQELTCPNLGEAPSRPKPSWFENAIRLNWRILTLMLLILGVSACLQIGRVANLQASANEEDLLVQK